MGMDLLAKNRGMCDLHMFESDWIYILRETGAGYLFGYGAHIDPGRYVYEDGKPVASNDGYEVSKVDALIMARLCRGYTSVKRCVNKGWEDMSESRKEYYLAMSKRAPIVSFPTDERRLLLLDTFASFAEQSEGFNIC
jgi:hypothetical protein